MILTFGCNSTPKGILPVKKMALIIADLKVLEAKVDNMYVNSSDSTRFVYRFEQQKIFEKYNIDSSTFNQSYDYYLRNKRELVKVFDKTTFILDDLYNKNQNILNLPDEKPGDNTDLRRNRQY